MLFRSNDDNYGEDEIDRSKLMPGAFTLDDAEEVLANSIIIAVMGVTGAGKSTLISQITGRQDITIGHGLRTGMLF